MIISLSRPLLLASHSPRRRQLLEQAGFSFSTEVRPTEECYPAEMPAAEVPAYLARRKAEEFWPDIAERLVLCADTIVVHEGHILNKPADAAEATQMLWRLSGSTHEVHTGVCLLDGDSFVTRTDTVYVTFRPLTEAEIRAYVTTQSPFDKAGGYGVQDWIGLAAITRIEGSYYTVMGLPTHVVYELLTPYFLS